MDVKFIETTKNLLPHLPIDDGQVIALLDKNEYYYDLGGTRHVVSSLVFLSELPESIGEDNKLYIVQGEDGTGIYTWKGENYSLLSGITSVKIEGEGNAVATISVRGTSLVVTLGNFATSDDLNAHLNDTENPHKLTAKSLGLEQVSNTPDKEKSVKEAGKLTTGREIKLVGDVNGVVTFDGSTNVEMQTTLSDTEVIPGNYGPDSEEVKDGVVTIPVLSVDKAGRITGIKNLKVKVRGAGGSGSEDEDDQSVESSVRLRDKRILDGILFDGTADAIHYGVCASAAESAIKEVRCPGYTRKSGAWVMVRFVNTNAAESPVLQLQDADGTTTVSGTIRYMNEEIDPEMLEANGTYIFAFDGTYFQLVGGSGGANLPFLLNCKGDSRDSTKLQEMLDKLLSLYNNAEIIISGNYGGTSPITLNGADGQSIAFDWSNAKVTSMQILKISNSNKASIRIRGLNIAAGTSPAINIDGDGPIRFENCQFTYSNASSVPVLDTSSAKTPDVMIQNCDIVCQASSACRFIIPSCSLLLGNSILGKVEMTLKSLNLTLDSAHILISNNLFSSDASVKVGNGSVIDLTYNNLVI